MSPAGMARYLQCGPLHWFWSSGSFSVEDAHSARFRRSGSEQNLFVTHHARFHHIAIYVTKIYWIHINHLCRLHLTGLETGLIHSNHFPNIGPHYQSAWKVWAKLYFSGDRVIPESHLITRRQHSFVAFLHIQKKNALCHNNLQDVESVGSHRPCSFAGWSRAHG